MTIEPELGVLHFEDGGKSTGPGMLESVKGEESSSLRLPALRLQTSDLRNLREYKCVRF